MVIASQKIEYLSFRQCMVSRRSIECLDNTYNTQFLGNLCYHILSLGIE